MSRDTRPDRKKAEFWKHQRPRYLLSGLMKCGVCGANYTKYGASRFACAGARDRATCANGITVRGDDVENAILDGLKSRLMEPALFEEFALGAAAISTVDGSSCSVMSQSARMTLSPRPPGPLLQTVAPPKFLALEPKDLPACGPAAPAASTGADPSAA